VGGGGGGGGVCWFVCRTLTLYRRQDSNTSTTCLFNLFHKNMTQTNSILPRSGDLLFAADFLRPRIIVGENELASTTRE